MKQTYADKMREIFDNDEKIRQVKKQTWDIQAKIQEVNLKRSILTGELQQLKIKIEERKLEIKKENDKTK